MPYSTDIPGRMNWLGRQHPRPEFDSISSRYHRMDSLPNPVLIRVYIFLVRDIRTSFLYTSDLLYILITKLQILHTRDRTFATYPSLYNRVKDLDRKEGSLAMIDFSFSIIDKELS